MLVRQCLNPCCSGQWSSTLKGKCIWFKVTLVLILVVVDNGLVLTSQQVTKYAWESLNPCCSGQWSSTTVIVNNDSNVQVS